jgi:hypothetical protein
MTLAKQHHPATDKVEQPEGRTGELCWRDISDERCQ